MEGDRRAEAGSSSASRTLRDVLGSPTESGDDALVHERNAELDEEEVEGEEDEEVGADGFVPGPLIPLKEQLEKDKDDESLRRWKEKLLGCLEGELNGQMEPEVTFHSIGIVSEGCAETITPLPVADNQSCVLFILKEGSQYRLKLTFSVKHNIVSGLTYSNTVWKKGLQVDQRKGMLGTFAPQRGPYEHLLEEETTPSGSLARGIYLAKLKFEDDDKRCHLELDYYFEIKKR
ncbi:rho GDP-dissociation inhibitor 1 [Elaeis guineensis]|uniref:Rho GDP-dissociation inhibitor 1 n=1 Tax=Elaeis guineensis var. tenera TaxID=51953 RepID=A0A6I9S2M2_ELAGV|nr:rho GDP-dissociation inhibitor 1 [Elaeis guineensis]